MGKNEEIEHFLDSLLNAIFEKQLEISGLKVKKYEERIEIFDCYNKCLNIAPNISYATYFLFGYNEGKGNYKEEK